MTTASTDSARRGVPLRLPRVLAAALLVALALAGGAAAQNATATKAPISGTAPPPFLNLPYCTAATPATVSSGPLNLSVPLSAATGGNNSLQASFGTTDHTLRIVSVPVGSARVTGLRVRLNIKHPAPHTLKVFLALPGATCEPAADTAAALAALAGGASAEPNAATDAPSVLEEGSSFGSGFTPSPGCVPLILNAPQEVQVPGDNGTAPTPAPANVGFLDTVIASQGCLTHNAGPLPGLADSTSPTFTGVFGAAGAFALPAQLSGAYKLHIFDSVAGSGSVGALTSWSVDFLTAPLSIVNFLVAQQGSASVMGPFASIVRGQSVTLRYDVALPPALANPARFPLVLAVLNWGTAQCPNSSALLQCGGADALPTPDGGCIVRRSVACTFTSISTFISGGPNKPFRPTVVVRTSGVPDVTFNGFLPSITVNNVRPVVNRVSAFPTTLDVLFQSRSAGVTVQVTDPDVADTTFSVAVEWDATNIVPARRLFTHCENVAIQRTPAGSFVQCRDPILTASRFDNRMGSVFVICVTVKDSSRSINPISERVCSNARGGTNLGIQFF